MWNFQKKDPSAGYEVDNLEVVTSITGTEAESVFHMIPCAMHAVAGPLIPSVFLAHHLIWETRHAELAQLLRHLAEVINNLRGIFSDVRRRLNKDDFYDLYRPMLGAFWPDGITLTGVGSGEGLHVKAREPDVPCWQAATGMQVAAKGPSAGQSTMVLMFDILLGVSHKGVPRDFQDDMCSYMPAQHRQMVFDFRDHIKRTGSVAMLIRQEGTTEEVKTAFNRCVTALHNLRSFHLGIATTYLTNTETGTGTSGFRSMLKEIVDDTKRAILS